MTATWLLKGLEGYPVKYLALSEAVSDSRGEFEIAGWGPRFHLGQGRLLADEPEIRIIASGYVPRRLDNGVSGQDAGAFVRFSKQGGTFRLQRSVSSQQYEQGCTGLGR